VWAYRQFTRGTGLPGPPFCPCGKIILWFGEFASAREHVERGLALYSPTKHAAHAWAYAGHDPGVCGWVQGGVSLWFLGCPEQAVEHVRRAVVLAEQIAHPPSVAHVLNHGILYHQLQRDRATIRAWGDRIAALAVEHGLALYEPIGTVARGWVLETVETLYLHLLGEQDRSSAFPAIASAPP
jgi:hypothetical protein